MKTSELTGAALDWAVAKAEGYSTTSDGISTLLKRGEELLMLGPGASPLNYSPSTDWAQGGPIIEREGISTVLLYGSTWGATTYPVHQIGKDHSEAYYQGTGPTPLVAAMRCYVASKLGDEVELPAELTGE